MYMYVKSLKFMDKHTQTRIYTFKQINLMSVRCCEALVWHLPRVEESFSDAWAHSHFPHRCSGYNCQQNNRHKSETVQE